MLENEPILQYAWLYIAIDIRNLEMCKVGITTRETPIQRINEGRTTNPFYLLFNSYDLSKFKLTRKKLMNFERFVQQRLGASVSRIVSGSNSEWIRTTPFNAEQEIDYRIANDFSSDDELLFDEDGEILEEKFKEIKYPYRPDPFNLSVSSNLNYEECKNYIDYLMDHHNYPTEPPSFLRRR